MILGLGTDIIEVARIKKLIDSYDSNFLDRIFTVKEQEYCKKFNKYERHYAGRFAAKEAIVKALGTGFGKDASFHDIEILNDRLGKPVVFLSEKLQSLIGSANVQLSISHCHEYATAVAILLETNAK